MASLDLHFLLTCNPSRHPSHSMLLAVVLLSQEGGAGGGWAIKFVLKTSDIPPSKRRGIKCFYSHENLSADASKRGMCSSVVLEGGREFELW